MTFHQIITVFDTWKRNDILFENSLKLFGSFLQLLVAHIENEKVDLSKTKRQKVLKRVYSHIKGFMSNEIYASKNKSASGEAVLGAIGTDTDLIDVKFLLLVLEKYQSEYSWIGDGSTIMSITHTANKADERRDWSKTTKKSLKQPNLNKYKDFDAKTIEYLTLFIVDDLLLENFRNAHIQSPSSVIDYLEERRTTHYSLLLDIANDFKADSFHSFQERLKDMLIAEVLSYMQQRPTNQVFFKDVKSYLCGPFLNLISCDEIRAALNQDKRFETGLTWAKLLDCGALQHLERKNVDAFILKIKRYVEEAKNDDDSIAIEKILLLIDACEEYVLTAICNKYNNVYKLMCRCLNSEDLAIVQSEIKEEIHNCLYGKTMGVNDLHTKVLRALRKYPHSMFIDISGFTDLISCEEDFVVVSCNNNAPIIAQKRKSLQEYPTWFTEVENSVLHLMPDEWSSIGIDELFQKLWGLELKRDQRNFVFSPIQSHFVRQQYFKRFILQYPTLYILEDEIVYKKHADPVVCTDESHEHLENSLQNEESAEQSHCSESSLSPNERTSSGPKRKTVKYTTSEPSLEDAPSHQASPEKKPKLQSSDGDIINSVFEKLKSVEDIQSFALDSIHKKKSDIPLTQLTKAIYREFLDNEEKLCLKNQRELKAEIVRKITLLLTPKYPHFIINKDPPFNVSIHCLTRHISNITKISNRRVRKLLDYCESLDTILNILTLQNQDINSSLLKIQVRAAKMVGKEDPCLKEDLKNTILNYLSVCI